MPDDTPRAFVDECRHYGAEVSSCRAPSPTPASGCARTGPHDAFDVSTLKEPYRVEGKKTMAYELYEQLGGELPDVIVYPTGGGTGLVGMWKAFAEMQRARLAAADASPRLVSVQAAGCAPVVRAFVDGAAMTEPWPDPATRAWGLRVPSPIGGFFCLRALRETNGTAVAVDEASIAPAAAAGGGERGRRVPRGRRGLGGGRGAARVGSQSAGRSGGRVQHRHRPEVPIAPPLAFPRR